MAYSYVSREYHDGKVSALLEEIERLRQHIACLEEELDAVNDEADELRDVLDAVNDREPTP